jgi:hypothetical protein
MGRWSKLEKNVRKRDSVARETAINVLRRRPLQIVGLTLKTYMGYWGIASIQGYARSDLGYVDLTDDQVKTLAEKFRFKTVKKITSQPRSLLQSYFIAAWPYYFIVIVSPLTCALATCIGRQRGLAFLLFVHASILMVVITALSPQPSIRYLQPVSILTLFSIAISVDWLARRSTTASAQRT